MNPWAELGFGIGIPLILATIILAAKFVVRTRDQLRDDLLARQHSQDEKLDTINTAVNHRAVGEPSLVEMVAGIRTDVAQLLGRFHEHTVNDTANFERIDRRFEALHERFDELGNAR